MNTLVVSECLLLLRFRCFYKTELQENYKLPDATWNLLHLMNFGELFRMLHFSCKTTLFLWCILWMLNNENQICTCCQLAMSTLMLHGPRRLIMSKTTLVDPSDCYPLGHSSPKPGKFPRFLCITFLQVSHQAYMFSLLNISWICLSFRPFNLCLNSGYHQLSRRGARYSFFFFSSFTISPKYSF